MSTVLTSNSALTHLKMTIDKDQEEIETVQVALRIRPLIDSEISRGCEICLDTVPNEPQVQVKGLAFTYNHVFPPEVSQEEFYDRSIRDIVKRLHKGYNVTILAYGQTGSGKTFSMGTCYSESNGNYYDAGVIPRAVSDIFTFIDKNSQEFDFKVTVSFMELYQEQLYDLLSIKSRDQSVIDIREDNKGIVLPGLTEEKVTSVEQTMACLVRGSEGRATGATAMNTKSSRSHAIFTVHIIKENREDSNQSTTSKFHLVDLAGSERSKKTKATGDRFKEGVKINQGLLALGNVISALGDGSNKGFIGYRDSKLTRLLQDSLGGNSVTLMIACVSPADYNLEESISTLRYADRARRIRNKPIVNQDSKSAEILRLNSVIQQLRLQILNEGKGNPQDVTDIMRRLEEEKLKNISLSEKYLEVLAKNKNLTALLQKSICEHTTVVERAIMAESSKEKVERKLAELNEVCDRTIEHLKENMEKTINNETIETIVKMKSKIADVQSEQLQCGQIINNLINEEEVQSSGRDPNSPSADLDEHDMNEKEEAHAMDQVARNKELKDLIKSLSEKKNLAEKLTANNQYLISYNESMKESEIRIISLEREKDELLHQLKTVQRSKVEPQVLAERKEKVQHLESEISELKKKCLQQANLIKIKEKNDAKIATLNNEIQAMKSAKVRLIKMMRSESDRFRTWKLQNEKQIAKLCNQDRKMQTAMVRMENKYTKQQYVLKRKMEEAVATNKRLKEALERQKNAQKQRFNSNNGKTEAIHQWVEQELELTGSLVAAQHTLEGLMEDRGTLNVQLEALKKENPKNPNIASIHEDIQLRNAQIADLQQKILAGDQENKAKTKWDTVQTMVEAKLALKYLFEAAAESKREILSYKYKDEKDDNKLEELKETYKSTTDKITELEDQIAKVKSSHRFELAEMEKQHEEKLTTLIKQLNCTKADPQSSSPNRNLLDRLEILQDAFERIKHNKDELETEISTLRQENEAIKTKKHKKVIVKSKTLDETVVKMDWDDDEFDEDDDNDPDWIKTPLVKRTTSRPLKVNRTTINFSDDSQTVKRNSDGQTKCSCKTKCSNKICGCRKLGLMCGMQCKCDNEKCVNQDTSSYETNATKSDETSDGSDQINNKVKYESENESDDTSKKPRLLNDENDSKILNRDIKKRSFFYPRDSS